MQQERERRKNRRRNIGLSAAAAVLLLLPAISFAQTGELYGAAAPDDAAFVRVFNNHRSGDTFELWIGSTEYVGVEQDTLTPYRPVSPGVHSIFNGGASAELIAQDGDYYTVVLLDDGPLVVKDPALTRADRAQILLYNLLPGQSAGLSTADREVEVIPAVSPRRSGGVVVNPAEAEFAVVVGESAAADSADSVDSAVEIGDIGLERGQSYAVFVHSRKNEAAAVVHRAAVLAE
ncbi:MAG: alginate O-acetyltransferase AlgF [Spirochaeta sp.]